MTRRQAELLDYLKRYAAEHKGACPSYAEMMRALGLRSKSVVSQFVCGLEKQGYVKRHRGMRRNVEVLR